MAAEISDKTVATEAAGADEKQSNAPGMKSLVSRLTPPRWLVVLVVASVMIPSLTFAYSRLGRSSAPVPASPEVDLGVFQFEADQQENGRVAKAEFSLHIALLDQVHQLARLKLQSHRFRVQQDIEQLLRQAHSGDFDDPGLAELKRQLQEQINETLGLRAIADVIITDLKLEQREGDLGPISETAEVVPWIEAKPSS
ncbi:MAG: flagellar basal body-associated FliL family protein [Pirellulales bacterium]|nr:flagellar basal body-associated FliL family protein [Pirellulales bacterium]